ncbi:UNVERIFIED_CONTAM: hypothetical protein PYX00_001796 [Menopon gallinae]|uniref:BRCT domain-containing protein n=1 Tax=Menopon gallinae TaxID=328185 RepID=A0AAW2IEG2_9NEOP
MSQVENLTVYFVLQSDTAGELNSSSDMRLAFNTVIRYGGNAKWVKPSSCLSMATSSKDVFVFENFEGQAFEDMKKHSAKYVILGVRCILTCISSGRSIPSSPTPVYSEGMRDLVICCTGFDSPIKKELQEKVEYMAGIYVKSLRAITTHLVAHNNISPKAIEAYKSNLPIMKCEWIEAVWEKSKYSNINGNDDEFKSYISPLFHNLKVTTSGIGRKEKEKIKELIEEHGGTFSGALEEKNTNVLIVAKPEGEKFKFAKSWNIPCVKPSWVYDSVESKVIHNLNSYGLDSKVVKSSTPKKDAMNFTANFSMMSAIAQDSDRMITHLEETHATMSLDNMKSQFATPKKVHPSDNICDVINNVLLKNLKDAGQFLDGCNIYLCGFTAEDMEKLKKVLNVGGATRFNDLNEFVTHVIVGKKTDSLLATLKNVSAHIVSVNWLAESMKLKKPAPEGDHSVLGSGVKRTEPPSPLSKLGAKLLTTLESKEPEKPEFDLDKENEKLIQLQEEELLNKYKQSQPGEPLTPRENPLSRSNSSSLQSRTGSLQPNTEFFKGLNFFLSTELVERERKELEEIISSKGGQVVGKRFLGIPDYAIVPITGATLTEITTKEVVNVFFIKDCYFEDSIVNLQYYHYPVACVKDSKPLKDCVISVSNYIQCEREFIEVMIEILGATPQSLLARKPKENILKSTHLICSEATGQKYNGAIRWGLPVVHHDWLLKCAALGVRVSEQPYLIGESKTKFSAAVNETSNKSKCVEDVEKQPADSEAALNKSRDQQTLSQLKSLCKSSMKTTPLHSAVSRLKNNETPKSSPDVNRTQTPTSPYGAFYGNENPSPGTRKRLWKWMNQGADFPQDPPSNYSIDPPRRDSTPLSEVLSKFLVQMKRKPEEIPTDSPVSTKRTSEPDGVAEIPVKKLNLGDEDAPDKEDTMKHDSVITTGLQKMKEIEENYTKNCAKPLTPVRKQSDSAPQMLVVTESQPHTEVGWEDPNEKEIALKKLEMAAAGAMSEKVFMVTRVHNAEEVCKLIEECGGKVSRMQHFDRNATHLISMDLTRDEKLMASITAGLWVLHPSYIDELKVVRDVHKIPEEWYEWGNPNKKERISNMPANAKAFAACSMEWRLAIKSGAPPAFKDMKIILHLRPSTYHNFRRLVEAGGGQVVNAKPPYSADLEADVCVVDTRYNEEVDFETLARKKIPCVTILYLNDRILKKEDAIDKNIAQPYLKFWNKKTSLLKYVNSDLSSN